MRAHPAAIPAVAVLALAGASGRTEGAAPCFIQMVGGDAHTLALHADGTVWAWGDNQYGQLGDGTTVESHAPVQVRGLRDIVWLGDEQEAEEHSLALARDGTVWAWGANSGGQLGDGTNTQSSVPVHVVGLTNVIDIAGGEEQSLALRADGTVWQWGAEAGSNVPVQVPGLTDIVQLGGGGDVGVSAALQRDGSVWTWNATTAPSKVLASWGLLEGCTNVACGNNHWLAIDAEGGVLAWGENVNGALGDGTMTNRSAPVAVPLPGPAVHIAGHETGSYALLRDGSVWGWGTETGAGGANSRSPVLVSGLHDVVWLAAGDHTGLAIEADGSLWSWGWNDHGQNGDGTTTAAYKPIRVALGPLDPIPGDQGNVLAAVKRLPDVTLDFRLATAGEWRVYRDASKLQLGRTAITPDVSVASFVDPGIVLAAPALELYRVAGLSPCAHTPGPN